MVYFLLLLMILSNAGETISYKNSKSENQLDILFGVSFWSLLLSSLAMAIFCIVDSESIVAGFHWENWLYILAFSVLGILTIIFWSKASKNLPMSIAEGVSEIYIAFLTFFSWLLFGGKLTIWHIVLILVVVVACFLLAFLQNKNKYAKEKYNYKLGFIFLAVWVIIYIVRGLLPGALASSGMNGIVSNFFLCIVMQIIIIFILLIKKHSIKKATINSLKDPWLFVNGLCRMANQISLMYLAFSMNLGVVEAVSVFGIVLIMLYERFVMKEKISLLSYVILVIIAIATAALVII